jgi:hypothetical protein
MLAEKITGIENGVIWNRLTPQIPRKTPVIIPKSKSPQSLIIEFPKI